jgi:hypothetical protein
MTPTHEGLTMTHKGLTATDALYGAIGPVRSLTTNVLNNTTPTLEPQMSLTWETKHRATLHRKLKLRLSISRIDRTRMKTASWKTW